MVPGGADGMARRIGALEAAVERRVEERMGEEIEAVLEVLEGRLPREEFLRVLEIVASLDGGEQSA